MFTIRRSNERGHANHGWLNTYHTFSFADYHDPKHMSFRSLRVMNEDRVAPGQGFGEHPHRDMEIISYVLEGSLAHRDSMGNGSVLQPGNFQRMSAGSGILHSEFNPSTSEPVHFYQIWLLPNQRGVEPSYEERQFAPEEKQNRLRLVASSDGREQSLTIHQDANVYLSNLAAGKAVAHALPSGRHAWLQVLRGSVQVHTNAGNGEATLQAGDGAAISADSSQREMELKIQAASVAEIMLFDLG